MMNFMSIGTGLRLMVTIGMTIALSFYDAAMAMAFEAKLVDRKRDLYVACFHESDVNALLRSTKLDKAITHTIERSSMGTAIAASWDGYGKTTFDGAFLFTKDGLRVENYPNTNGTIVMAFGDDLRPVCMRTNNFLVFQNGHKEQVIPEKPGPPQLMVWVAPGAEILALKRKGEPDYQLVRPSNPTNVIGVIDSSFELRRIIYTGSRIVALGGVQDKKGEYRWEAWTLEEDQGRWECVKKQTVPRAYNACDYNAELDAVLFTKRRFITGTEYAYLFDLKTEKVTRVGVDIWRNHGFVLQGGLVKKIGEILTERGGDVKMLRP